MAEQEYVCPSCTAARMPEECWHDESTWALAEALRDAVWTAVDRTPEWGTPVELAWAFIDDADALAPNVGAPPYAVTIIHPNDTKQRATIVGLVNGRYLFWRPNDEGLDVTCEFIADCGGRLAILPPAPAEEPKEKP